MTNDKLIERAFLKGFIERAEEDFSPDFLQKTAAVPAIGALGLKALKWLGILGGWEAISRVGKHYFPTAPAGLTPEELSSVLAAQAQAQAGVLAKKEQAFPSWVLPAAGVGLGGAALFSIIRSLQQGVREQKRLEHEKEMIRLQHALRKEREDEEEKRRKGLGGL